MIWAVGDIQGCYDPFVRLLEKIGFDPDRDRLWLVGDLVNRGRKSREVLEFLYGIRDSLQVVLGNHDLTLLAIYWGLKGSNPTLDPILEDPRCDAWMAWIRSLPFVHVDYALGWAMAHAGIPPKMDLGAALHYDRVLRERLAAEDAAAWLEKIMAKNVDHFDPSGSDLDHERYVLGGFTRMRFCTPDGRLDFDRKGPPDPKLRLRGLYPWFECPGRIPKDLPVVFGHWSTLGYRRTDEVLALDTGCVWQGRLTAVRLDAGEGVPVQVACPEGIKPKGRS